MEENHSPALTDHLGYWLRLVSNAVSHGFARRLEAEDVTVAEWVFLSALQEAEGAAPTALADRMGMTRGAISKLAERTLAKGLIRRDQGEGRGQMLFLTAAGLAKLPILQALADENDATWFAPLSLDDRTSLLRLMQRLAQAHDLTKHPLE